MILTDLLRFYMFSSVFYDSGIQKHAFHVDPDCQTKTFAATTATHDHFVASVHVNLHDQGL